MYRQTGYFILFAPYFFVANEVSFWQSTISKLIFCRTQ